MNKVKYLLLSLLGLLMFSSCQKIGQYIVDLVYDDGTFTVGEVTYEGPIEKIDINWINGAIKVEYHANDNELIEIKEEIKGIKSVDDLRDYQYLRSSFTNNELKVYYCAPGEIYFPVNFYKELTISLPESTSLRSINCHSISSKDYFSSLNCDSYDLYSTSGEIYMNSLETNELSITSVSGSITLSDVTINDELLVDTVSGNIDLKQVEANEINVQSVSGNLLVKENDTRNVSFITTSGNLNYSLKENEGFNVAFDSTSGSFSSNVNYSRDGNVYSYLGEIMTYIGVSSVSGNVKINKTTTI
ncbi:MAG: DUF4097 family beta strand repeat-containing protein [Bacilli bacterium]